MTLRKISEEADTWSLEVSEAGTPTFTAVSTNLRTALGTVNVLINEQSATQVINVMNEFTSKMGTGKGICLTHLSFLFIEGHRAPGSFPGIHNSRPRLCCHRVHMLISKQIHKHLLIISATKKREGRRMRIVSERYNFEEDGQGL